MDEVRQLWDQAAVDFDNEADHGLREATVRRACTDLMTRLLPEAPARVADLGCGTGSLSVLLAELGYSVTAVDLSPKMIAVAGHKAAIAAVEIDFLVGDAADPELQARSFDVVMCRHVLWALPEPSAVFRRWVRLLTPQGIVVVIEGRWSTGAGLNASELRELIGDQVSKVDTEFLTNGELWGKPISDERYAMVLHPRW